MFAVSFEALSYAVECCFRDLRFSDSTEVSTSDLGGDSCRAGFNDKLPIRHYVPCDYCRRVMQMMDLISGPR
jgi:hypothetical protein